MSGDSRNGRTRMTAREVPPAIQWHEGMLLAPQHFQTLGRRQELLLHYHASAVSPFHWGLTHLEIDRVVLMDGVFRVVELEAVMPDGMLVSNSASDGTDLKIDLGPRAAEIAQQPAFIHLAVTARGRGHDATERYIVDDSIDLVDENSANAPLSVPVLRPRLQLVTSDALSPKLIHFPLAQVSYRNDVFDTTRYQAPWLRVVPGSVIYRLCMDLAARLRQKALYLSDKVRSPSTSARAAQLLETKALVHCLVGELPPFEALLRSGSAHPFALYLALCSLVGHAAGLGHALVPAPLEPYDHANAVDAFDRAVTSITTALDEGIDESYTAYPFAVDGDEYKLAFDPEWAGRSLVLGVRTPPAASEADTAAWVASSVIGGRGKIVSLRDRRVLGIRRAPVESDSDLVPSRGVSLYSIVADPELVAPGEEMVIVNPDPGARSPQEIVLYVRNRE